MAGDKPSSSTGGKGKKKKWSKGKTKEKANNAVYMDKATTEKMMKEIPTAKVITTATMVDRLKINGSVARKALRELEAKGVIKAVHRHASGTIYTRAIAVADEPVAAK